MIHRIQMLSMCCLVAAGISACSVPQRSAPKLAYPPETHPVTDPVRPDKPESESNTPVHVLQRIDERDDPSKWLFVEEVKNGARGGWATGGFDTDRNKITVRTQDVDQFAIDTSRIAIDWERVVILGIDGRNSELRKRDQAIYQISRDEHGRWVVVE